ncbi:MAG: deoxyribose-phosphate aldolase [Nitrospirae bacterium]|nr:deoxyribose-phosphate aldolase [Nitrospirota bacterium]
MFKDRKDLASRIEHTLLRLTATKQEISKLCDEAKGYSFRAVCINPVYVSYVRNVLSGTRVKVCTVIGFPLGSNRTPTKVFEAMEAVKDGADELDIVINLGALKESKWDDVRKEISDIVMATPRVTHKIIIETCYLTDDEKKRACEVIIEAGAEFVKTSTGYSPSGAKVRDIKLIKSVVGNKIRIKASGGVKTLFKAFSLIKVGANTIGTSSGVSIMEELVNHLST